MHSEEGRLGRKWRPYEHRLKTHCQKCRLSSSTGRPGLHNCHGRRIHNNTSAQCWGCTAGSTWGEQSGCNPCSYTLQFGDTLAIGEVG